MGPSEGPRSGGAPGRAFFGYFLCPSKESDRHAGPPPAQTFEHRLPFTIADHLEMGIATLHPSYEKRAGFRPAPE